MINSELKNYLFEIGILPYYNCALDKCKLFYKIHFIHQLDF